MNRYVTYKRVSTEDQGKSGLGLEAQTRDIGLYLDTYSPEPWEVIAEFVEVESGANGDRPELRKAIDLARKAGATLLVSKLDRLSRKVSFIAALMDDAKLSFRVASMPYADKFQLHIYAALAEQERDFISKRTKAALREKRSWYEGLTDDRREELRSQGKATQLGGLRDTAMKRNAVVKANADARARKLEGIVRPLRDANATLRDIAVALNGAGIETPRGGEWHPTSVARLLERLDA